MKTIDDLIEKMGEEAKKWNREGSSQSFVNAQGIQEQWDEAETFPCQIFYMDGKVVTVNEAGVPNQVSFNVMSEWFDEEGYVTERPSD